MDPNRVLDIILESFENNLALYDTFIGLLKHYKAEEDTIGQIIGFKYQSLHQLQLAHHQKIVKEIASTNSKDNKPQQPHYDAAFLENLIAEKIDLSSLYQVTAHLLKHKIVDLDLLLPHVITTMTKQTANILISIVNYSYIRPISKFSKCTKKN